MFVVSAFKQQTELEKPQISDNELFSRVVATVAQREMLPEAEIRAAINHYIVAVRADPKAAVMDRALADFALRKSGGAVANAGPSALRGRSPQPVTDGMHTTPAARAEEPGAPPVSELRSIPSASNQHPGAPGTVGDLSKVQARLKQRLGTVSLLLDRQMVGENNRGYLDVRSQVGGK